MEPLIILKVGEAIPCRSTKIKVFKVAIIRKYTYIAFFFFRRIIIIVYF